MSTRKCSPQKSTTNTEILQNVWKLKLQPQQVFQIHKIYNSKFFVIEIITLLSLLKQENTHENSIQFTANMQIYYVNLSNYSDSALFVFKQQ
jgi:hypothetical protein